MKVTNFLCLFLIITLGDAFALDLTCSNPDMLKRADLAYTENRAIIEKIPGVVRVEVADCSEIEAPAVTGVDGFVCGVFVWFDNSISESIFKATTKIWSGQIGSGVPTCSRTTSRVLSVRE